MSRTTRLQLIEINANALAIVYNKQNRSILWIVLNAVNVKYFKRIIRIERLTTV